MVILLVAFALTGAFILTQPDGLWGWCLTFTFILAIVVALLEATDKLEDN